MKLKFEKEVEDVINEIAALPDTACTDEDIWKPNAIIGELDNALVKQSNAKNVPMKHWAKLRRQLSFLYEIVRLASEAAEPAGQRPPQVAVDAKKNAYGYMVKIAKGMVSGQELTQTYFVRLALNYGVLHLSDHELAKLIENHRG